MIKIDAQGMEIREINRAIRRLAEEHEEIVVRNPAARHHLGVGLLRPVRLLLDGSVGYFCAGLCDGPRVEITNNAGWCLGDNLMSGSILVQRNAGSAAGSAMRGGTIVIRGNMGSRAGQVMKGGTLLCLGNTGFMLGYNLMGGRIVVLGDAGEGTGEWIIDGAIFVGGRVASLGHDATRAEPTEEDHAFLQELLAGQGLEGDRPFVKIVSAKELYNYPRKEY